eukprot:CAMPEP_0116913462 /NCGR_PEP_ID=MMETSP0467-20121206/16717_1 /TAXON_ID=283647 /ORGANISM="Mesodinium pulex, Strain SPMC105" /LENGTH=54 /DNA_ID=CAMNT_0004589679 /DNA_START=976 /DNA_END=1140 /DNA_ORIENTATION=-
MEGAIQIQLDFVKGLKSEFDIESWTEQLWKHFGRFDLVPWIVTFSEVKNADLQA